MCQGLQERSPAPAPTPSAFLSGVGILASSSGRAHGAEKVQIHFAWGVWGRWWGLVVPPGTRALVLSPGKCCGRQLGYSRCEKSWQTPSRCLYPP